MNEIDQQYWKKILEWGRNLGAHYLELMEGNQSGPFEESNGYSQTVLGMEIHMFFQKDERQISNKILEQPMGNFAELCRILQLDLFERFCTALVFLSELEYSFEKLFVYLNNDWNQRLLSVEWAIKLFTMEMETDSSYLKYFLDNHKLSQKIFQIKTEGSGSVLRKGLRLKKTVWEFLLHGAKFSQQIYFQWHQKEPEDLEKRIQPAICQQLISYGGKGMKNSECILLRGIDSEISLFHLIWYAKSVNQSFAWLDYACMQAELEAVDSILEEVMLSEGILGIRGMEELIKEEKEQVKWQLFLRKASAMGIFVCIISEEEMDALYLPMEWNCKVIEIPMWEPWKEEYNNQRRHQLNKWAVKIKTNFSWGDLIISAEQKDLLMEAVNQMKYRYQVYEEWGFSQTIQYGTGLSVLLTGPPGTGKTMAAQVLAGELGLELFKIQLPMVVSKYIGETEKNLKGIFQEGERSQAILFFDEADVLFSKRTEVKDSHDKYSNMEAAFMLQKIEEYTGVILLATNFPQNIDEAFKRRIKFTIEFSMPDREQRYQLWCKSFPEQLPLDYDVDLEWMAETFELSGSNIKNIAVNAAFLAAAEQKGVGKKQILRALKNEYKKSGKYLTEGELNDL